MGRVSRLQRARQRRGQVADLSGAHAKGDVAVGVVLVGLRRSLQKALGLKNLCHKVETLVLGILAGSHAATFDSTTQDRTGRCCRVVAE